MRTIFHPTQRAIVAVTMILVTALTSGCSPTQPFYFFEDGDLSHYVGMATNIEYPDVTTCSLEEVDNPPPPLTIRNPDACESWDLCLQDAVRIALENGKVMRALGVRLFITPNTARTQVVQTPEILTTQPGAVMTVYEPALFETDPVFGPEGALSVYDAQLSASLFWERNDRPLNTIPVAAIQNQLFVQDLSTFQAGITKRTATGAEFSFFNNTVYDANNRPSNEVPSTWNQNFELGFRQPLLQGAGSQYNRIAGPFDPLRGIGTYLQWDGVVIARIRTDIRLADFEAGVRNFVADVENAYWELYFGYRNLEARKTGRDSALQTWKKVNELKRQGARGGEADKEAQAREQYFFFRSEVETALGDLYRAENRLRYMMGLAATDGRLIRPCDEPTDARVVFDWCEVHAEGLCRAVELRQQKWRIKQRELELIASKNLLLPRLDAVGRYRWLGLGDDLIDYPGEPFTPTPSSTDTLVGTDAFSTLSTGDFQEWQIGMQLNIPIGFRRELAAVRNQQLLLARERSILQDQELELSHQMADAIRDIDTNYQLAQTNFNRRNAADNQVEAVQVAYEAGTVPLDFLLEAQRRRADAEAAYYRSLTDYNKAIMLVHFRKGSLLEYNGVFLAEGPWPAKAYFDATRRARARDAATYIDYGYTRPAVFSLGPYEQFQHTGGMLEHGAGEGMPVEAPANQPEEIPPPRRSIQRQPAEASLDSGSVAAADPHAAPATVEQAVLNETVPGLYDMRARRTRLAEKKPDSRVVLATAEEEAPFEWGDLSIEEQSVMAKKDSKPSGKDSAAPSKSSSAHETAPPQSSNSSNQPPAGWKRAQR